MYNEWLASPSIKTPLGIVLTYSISLCLLSAALLQTGFATEFDTPYVTRAEAAQILLLSRLPSVPTLRNLNRFPDIQSDTWYEPYMILAERYGILRADPLGRLRPNEAINRTEFLKMLTYTFGLPENLQQGYLDVGGGYWYVPFAGIAYQYGLLPYNETFPKLAPGNPLTHKEVAAALERLFEERGTNFPPLEILADARNAAAERLQLFLVISHMEEEVTIIRKPTERWIQRVTPKPAPMKPKLSFEDVLDAMRIGELRREMLTAVNGERQRLGLRSLTFRQELHDSAQRYAEKMSRENSFGHNGPDGETFQQRIERSGYYNAFTMSDCNTGVCAQTFLLGENLARGQKSVKETMDAWMRSDEHRRAILHPGFREIGVGISAGYWVQHFAGIKLSQ